MTDMSQKSSEFLPGLEPTVISWTGSSLPGRLICLVSLLGRHHNLNFELINFKKFESLR